MGLEYCAYVQPSWVKTSSKNGTPATMPCFVVSLLVTLCGIGFYVHGAAYLALAQEACFTF